LESCTRTVARGLKLEALYLDGHARWQLTSSAEFERLLAAAPGRELLITNR
jgi:hypothetical protein